MPGQGRTFFILEDDPDFREDLAEALIMDGHTVASAESVQGADPAAVAGCDILLLDLALPCIDGIGMLCRLKDLPHPPSLIFMSGSGEELLGAASALARNDGLRVLGTLAKPFALEDVVALASEADLDRTARHAAPAAPPLAFETLLPPLRAAVRDGTLPVLFQPILTSDHMRFAGAEALLGNELPGYGPVMPKDMVAAAAIDPRLLRDLTLFVLKRAISACKAWETASDTAHVSVNVPLTVLEETGIVGTILTMVQDAGASARQIVLELTEDEIYATSHAALGAIAQLRLAGFGVALDDVAQRQSGLLQLSSLPVTEIKIDLELLRQARRWGKARSIFLTLADLGHRLGLKVVAEGVESLDDLMLARSASVDYIQGYIVSRKRPLSELLALQTMLGGACEPWGEPVLGVA